MSVFVQGTVNALTICASNQDFCTENAGERLQVAAIELFIVIVLVGWLFG